MEKMNDVFELAKHKATKRISKDGYTKEPWKDFDIDFLTDRLYEEIEEFRMANTIYKQNDELLDIINMAIFLYIANKEQKK